MTEIQYDYPDGETFILECRGHAGFADAGNDIVCAGISTLTQTLVAYLPEITLDFDYHIESGELFCYGRGQQAMQAFEMTLIGLKMLESQYPQHLMIMKKGCPNKTDISLS